MYLHEMALDIISDSQLALDEWRKTKYLLSLSSFPMNTVQTFFPPPEQPSTLHYTSTGGQFNFLFHFAQAWLHAF